MYRIRQADLTEFYISQNAEGRPLQAMHTLIKNLKSPH